MATDKTKAEKEYTVEEKLKTLYDLQTILSEIDRIKTLKFKTLKMRLQVLKLVSKTFIQK